MHSLLQLHLMRKKNQCRFSQPALGLKIGKKWEGPAKNLKSMFSI